MTKIEFSTESETFPVEPHYHPVHRLTRRIYDFLASAKLAMSLLVVILICCIVGVTIFRGEQAWEMIFNAIWFNAILVLLVVNVACCFFGRIWGRRVTTVTVGMILFHLSFVSIFLGIVYNSLFLFRGVIRLTEGETLTNATPENYDKIQRGRFFDFAKLKGETSLVKLHSGYKIDGKDKRVAYEIVVGEGGTKTTGMLYVTHNLSYRGFTYIPEKEGYSLLVVLADLRGNELHGAHVPLQSLKQNDREYLYTNGTKEGPGIMKFPQGPATPLIDFNVVYNPAPVKERGGEAVFKVWHLSAGNRPEESLRSEGRAAIGVPVKVGEFTLSAREVRYWVAMTVHYEPGKPIVLASLWIGLSGMIISTIGRMMRRKRA